MWISTYCICNYVILYVYYILWNCFMSIEIWGTWDWRKTNVFWEMFFGIHKKMLAIIFMRNEIKFDFVGTILKEKKMV